MPSRKYTVLIIPEGSDEVRSINVRRRSLGIGIGAGLAILLGASLLGAGYFRVDVDRRELHRLQAENRRQGNEMQRLAASVENLRQEVVVLAQNDAKVRVLAKLTTPGDDLNGMGGPIRPEKGAALPEIQQRIDELRRAVDLRRQSQEEVQGILYDQRSLLAARPKGMPARGWLSSEFGMRISPISKRREMHEGIDIAAQTGTPVRSSADGIVTLAETAPGYGKLVVVDHGYGYQTYYGHNSEIHVKVGQRIRQGDVIASVGNTGSSTGPHLHYEVRLNGLPLNPRKYF